MAAGDDAPPTLRARTLHLLGNLAIDADDYPTARGWYEAARRVSEEIDDSLGLARALNGLGIVASAEGDLALAQRLHGQRLAIRRGQGDALGTALSLYNLGRAAVAIGELASARGLFEESLAIRRGLGDEGGGAFATRWLGVVALEEGDVAAGSELAARSLEVFERVGDRFGVADALHDLGRVALLEHDLPRAAAQIERSLTLHRELANREGLVESFEALAQVAARANRADLAARLLGSVAGHRAALGTIPPARARADREREAAALRAVLGADVFAQRWAAGEATTLDEAVAAALDAASTLREDVPTATPATEVGGATKLSPRELEVLRLLADGRSNREIADALFVSPRTVSTHVTNIFAKLGVATRAAATAHAVRHGLA